ncbi:MAG: hypothetical protein NZ703_08965, partial [Gemmataceae bacterium]|nr:hypothetical protein [Gemmataceae bacterium]
MLPLLQVPARDGEWLLHPPVSLIPSCVEKNVQILQQTPIQIDGMPLPDLRRLLRQEIAPILEPPLHNNNHNNLAERIWVVSGHQPELDHPGVWVKHFVLQGLSRHLGATPLHLIADHDLPKNNGLLVPRLPLNEGERIVRVPVCYDRADLLTPYEQRPLYDAELFVEAWNRVQELAGAWGFEPIALHLWPRQPPLQPRLVEILTKLRRYMEHSWGCINHELPVSRLAQTRAFRHFANHLLNDLTRFRYLYNQTLRRFRDPAFTAQPVRSIPELEPDEAPFWELRGQRRFRATRHSPLTTLRPRALTLTLFVRLVLGDVFIHGLGGALYDQITDALIKDYFGITPPAYLTVTATLHLPFVADLGDANPASADLVRRPPSVLWQQWRDIYWNPQRHLPSDVPAMALELARRRLHCVQAEPPVHDHQARRQWFQQLRSLTESLRSYVQSNLEDVYHQYLVARKQQQYRQILLRRDY